MGVSVSKENDARQTKLSKQIDEQLQKDKEANMDTIKLLLLGTAECGKSTILKQMKILHGIGFNEMEVNLQRSTIFNNVITSMNKIVKAMHLFSISFGDAEREADACVVQDSSKLAKEINFKLTTELSLAIKKLWADSGVQQCYLRGSEYQLYDSAKYFFDNIERYSRYDYVPDEQDILRARITTTGITEVKFEMKNTAFRVFDVGGQRSERRKWIHCFDDVDSVIFIASLSEYNMVLMEDGKTNRTHESIMLFETICNCQYFAKTSMILFLNKKDVFAEKIRAFPLTIAFPEYRGSQTYEEALTYIHQKYVHVKRDEQKHIYVHRTCATDTQGIQFVFDACFDIIFTTNMKKSGLF